MDILAEIFQRKRDELAAVKTRMPTARLEADIDKTPAPVSFADSLRAPDRPSPRLIAEFKRRSPSKGLLQHHLDPLRFARTCLENGAAALSVLTEENYFDGSLRDLEAISSAGIPLPILRKDFIFDSYQLLEARAAGASAILLIAAALEKNLLAELIREAHRLELAPLVEVHAEVEIDRALSAGANLIGVNNRNLRDFTVDLGLSLRLGPVIPANCIKISESGIKSKEDVERLAYAGFDGILVGEALMAPGSGPDTLIRELAGSGETALSRDMG
ncbi:MAG TPA: indole-3-glycerol phosphate synthase TrpC [Anaerolineales bacterium]|nr:indole-3-glycerol phosphate synthase TrpC [Anaerolineales bacterium]